MSVGEDGAIVSFQNGVDDFPGAFVVDVDLLGLGPEDHVESELLRRLLTRAFRGILHADASTNRVHTHSLGEGKGRGRRERERGGKGGGGKEKKEILKELRR